MSERTCNRISWIAALLLAAGVLAGIILPAGTGWDFANFYDAGHKVLAGQTRDLYDASVLIGGRKPQGVLPFYGAPITAFLFAAMAWMRPAAAIVWFKIEGTAAILIGLWLLYSSNLPLAQKTGLGRARYRTAFLIAAALFQPFWTIYRVGGQTTPTLFLGFVLAFLWLTAGRRAVAALVLVAVIAIKPAFCLVLIPLAAAGGRRFSAWVAGTGAAAVIGSVLALGWPIHQRFLEHVAAGKISSWPYNSSISVMFDSLRTFHSIPAGVLGVTGTAVRVLAAGFVISALLRARKRIGSPAAQRHFLFFAACAFGLVLMPVVWEHYLSVLFIAVAYFLAVLPLLNVRARGILGLFSLFCVTQNLIVSLWLRSWPQSKTMAVVVVLGLFKSAPLILFTVLLWRYAEQMAGIYDVTGPMLEKRAVRPRPATRRDDYIGHSPDAVIMCGTGMGKRSRPPSSR